MEAFFDIFRDNFFEAVCAVITTCAFAICSLIYRKIRGLIQAVLAMNHDQLYRMGEFYILTNQITVAELKNLEYLYSGYHAIGGNGTGTEIYEKCKELPVVDRRTKYNPYYTERAKTKEDAARNAQKYGKEYRYGK